MFSPLQRVNLCDLRWTYLYVCVYGEMWYVQVITGALKTKNIKCPGARVTDLRLSDMGVGNLS